MGNNTNTAEANVSYDNNWKVTEWEDGKTRYDNNAGVVIDVVHVPAEKQPDRTTNPAHWRVVEWKDGNIININYPKRQKSAAKIVRELRELHGRTEQTSSSEAV